MTDRRNHKHEPAPEPEKKSPISLGMIAGILGIVSAVAGMAYAYVNWHFDTFVYQDNMTRYQTKMTTQLDSIQKDLSDKSTLNYLEIIIILKEKELRELDEKVDSGTVLNSDEQRRQQSIADSIASFKEQRNKIIGLPEGLQ